jgi:molecular chaperone GrpE
MRDMKEKIEKYIQADQVGKESENHDPDKQETGGTSVKIKVDAEPDKKKTGTGNKAVRDASEPAEAGAEDPGDSPEAALEKALKEAKENQDRYLRISADFENYKKRTAREASDYRKFANETLIKEMLTIVDNLERAVDSSNNHSEDQTPIVEGVQMTLKAVQAILERFHVTPIDAMEKPFDPRFHQAFQQEESDKYPENTVLREFQRGYQLYDRLLRPSMVIVSKKKEPSDPEKESNNT